MDLKSSLGNINVDESLKGIKRIVLSVFPTPLQKGFTHEKGVTIWLKRDDLTGLGLGGNKVRKLEFLLGDALDKGCDTLVTFGALQSNHARLTAAAGAVCGMEVHLVLAVKENSNSTNVGGNIDVARHFGASIHFVEGDVLEAESFARDLCSSLSQKKKNPYFIPVGGSNGLSTLGYTVAMSETVRQIDEKHIKTSGLYVASSTRGTQAGLVAGLALIKSRHIRSGYSRDSIPKVVGVDVSQSTPRTNVVKFARGALDALGRGELEIENEVFFADTGNLEKNFSEYGRLTKSADEASIYAAKNLGIILDRTYCAKAFAALLNDIDRGLFSKGDNVVFLASGGHPSMFSSPGFPS